MALTTQQIAGLKVAEQRIAQGRGSAADFRNLDYAVQNQGYQRTIPAATNTAAPGTTTPGATTQTKSPDITSTGQFKPETLGVTTQPMALPNISPFQFPDQNTFGMAMNQIRMKLSANQDLVDQKQAILKQLYNPAVPLTPEEQKVLSPSQVSAINAGDRNLVDMEVRLINDQLANRTNTLDTSINYITQQYSAAKQDAETQFQNATQTVQQFVAQYGSNAGAALTALYGPGMMQKLKDMGIDINAFAQAGVPTVAQEKITAQYGSITGGVGSTTYDLSSYNPSNPNYPTQIQTLAQSIGAVTSPQQAQDYIQSVAPGSPITGQMVMNAANQFAVDPATVMALMQQESSFGTQGMATSTFNPGNVGNITGTKSTNQGSWQNGVNAVAQWLSNHQTESSVLTQAPNAGDPNSNIVDPSTGLTPNGLWQASLEYAQTGKMPSLGLGSAKQTRNARTMIINQAGAIAAQLGMSLPQLQQEYTATNKWLASANSTTQLRLRQSITSVSEAINLAKQANDDWNRSGLTPLNAAQLKIALAGGMGQQAQQIAAKFNQQLTIIQDELGQVFMSGNSPTDKALGLAQKTLGQNWSQQTLASALDNIQQNLGVRLGAIQGTGPIMPGQQSSGLLQTPATVSGPTITPSTGGGSASYGGVTFRTDVPGSQLTGHEKNAAIMHDIQQAVQSKQYKTREQFISALAREYGMSQSEAQGWVYAHWTDKNTFKP